jgi:hypothetical protein
MDSLLQIASLAADLLLRTVPVVILGIFIAEVLVALRVTDRIARAARPITTFAHLPSECGVSFMTAFLSSQAADAMLMDYYHNGRIGRREVMIAALMNSFPSIVMHWRYLLPVYLPLLGTVGLVYFVILMGIGLAKTGIVMAAGRVLLTPKDAGATLPESIREEERTWRGILSDALWSSSKTLRRILIIMVPTLVLVAFLIGLGVFDALGTYLAGVTAYFPVPVEGISIVAAKFGSYVAAASVASALLAAGDISGKGVVIALLVGNLLSSITQSARWFGSFYVAIFGPRLGTEIMVTSTLLRNGLVLIAIFALARLW